MFPDPLQHRVYKQVPMFILCGVRVCLCLCVVCQCVCVCVVCVCGGRGGEGHICVKLYVIVDL